MSLIRLEIANFRNLLAVNLEPRPHGFNLVHGQNGSGKTSLLEAIYYLSFARSFRSTAVSRIINNSAEKFSIFGHLQGEMSPPIPVGVERSLQSELKIRISGKDVHSIAELANVTPIQLINPHCYNLLEGGPLFRRKYLDWGMFYRNKDFIRLWRHFERTLKQRNAALQARRPRNELEPWTQELIASAQVLDEARKTYINQLLPMLLQTVSSLLTLPELKIQYQPGWDDTRDYQAILSDSMGKDLSLGYTQYGPHRADLKILINSSPAKDILSRGQQKLFVCAMILAQGALLRSCMNKKPIYLVDDLPSELDSCSRSNLLDLLSKQEAQVFITAIEPNALTDFLTMSDIKVFHVEHGQITEEA